MKRETSTRMPFGDQTVPDAQTVEYLDGARLNRKRPRLVGPILIALDDPEPELDSFERWHDSSSRRLPDAQHDRRGLGGRREISAPGKARVRPPVPG